MSSKKEIQHRIKSVKNTKKVTRAMEMVSAAKMRKAVEAVLKSRAYADLSQEIASKINQDKTKHPLFSPKAENSESKTAIILFSSNRGLCGGLNTNLIKKVINHKPLNTDKKIDIILIGKKGAKIIKNPNFELVADFKKEDTAFKSKDILPIVKLVLTDYQAGKYSQILLAYNHFKSAASQEPKIKQILPIINDKNKENDQKNKNDEYLFEPGMFQVLDALIPRMIEIQIFQALLESNASEHSARMAAMHQATESAGEMIEELTLSFNKARQASITQEIAEIVAGITN